MDIGQSPILHTEYAGRRSSSCRLCFEPVAYVISTEYSLLALYSTLGMWFDQSRLVLRLGNVSALLCDTWMSGPNES